MAIIYRKPQIYKDRTKIDANTLICWAMDETTLPYANSGTGGTLNLTTYEGTVTPNQTGLFNKCASFPAGLLTTGNTSIQSAYPITISAWIYANDVPLATSMIVSKNCHADHTWADPYGFSINVQSDQFWYVSIVTGATWSYVVVTNPLYKIPIRQWALLALIYNGATLQGFINGNLACTTNVNGAINYLSNGPWNVGGMDKPGMSNYFNGKIEDVRIESVARSSSYLLDMYNSVRLNNKYKLGINEPIVEYEPSAAGVRLYSEDLTKVDRLWNRTTDSAVAKIAVQNTLANMPIWTENDSDFNNKGSLAFNGSQFITTGNWAVASVQPNTYYVVCKFGTIPSAEFLFDGIDASNRNAIYIDPDGTVHAYAGAGISSAGSKKSTTCIICFTLNGATSEMYINNAATAYATGTCSTQGVLGLEIGADYAHAENFKGKIAYLCSYSGVHTTAQRTSVMQDLATKFRSLPEMLLQSSNGFWIDSSKTATITNVSGRASAIAANITSGADFSGFTLSQADAARQPLISTYAGNPVLYFDPTNAADWKMMLSNTIAGKYGWHVFLVGAFQAVTADATILDGPSVNINRLACNPSGGNVSFASYGGGGWTAPPVGYPPENSMLVIDWVVGVPSGIHKIGYNGGTQVSSNVYGTNANTAWSIGTSPGFAIPTRMRITDFYLIMGERSTQERADLVAYFKAARGIA